MVGKRNIIPENKDKECVKESLATATPLEDPSLLHSFPGQTQDPLPLHYSTSCPGPGANPLGQLPGIFHYIISALALKRPLAPRPLCPLLFFILLISRHKFQIVGGCDVVVSPQLQQHLLGILRHRPVHGDEDLGHLPVDLRPEERASGQRVTAGGE